jgi:transposase
LWSTKTSFAKEARMLDAVCPPKRMRYSLESRCRIVRLILDGASPQAAAAACGASRATGYRLWRRFQEGGWAALADRPSTPKRQPRRLPAQVEQEILAWREHVRAGPAVIAAILQRPISTVGKVLRRAGCSRLPRPQRDPKVRYERDRPGELLHVDTKKLGRFWQVGKAIHGDRRRRSRKAGWLHLHVAIDDHSRLAYAELLPTERAPDCAAFLARAVAWYAEQGIVVERVLTDG